MNAHFSSIRELIENFSFSHENKAKNSFVSLSFLFFLAAMYFPKRRILKYQLIIHSVVQNNN